MGTRRAIAAFLTSQAALLRPSERRMRRDLRPLFASYLDDIRRLAKANNDAALQRRFRDASNALRKKASPVVRRTSVYEAQQAYNDTLGELRKLGRRAQDKTLTADQRKEVLDEIDKLVTKRFEPLPDRMLNRVGDLRGNKDLRPLAKGLADVLARDAATLARVEGERIANEEQGTGYWQWVTVGDTRVRNSHKRVRGQRRRIGTKFGNDVRYPRDPLGPIEETANCRCHTRPARAPRTG